MTNNIKLATDLLIQYTDFINKLDKQNLIKNISLEKIAKLKSVFSNINNLMTLLATHSIANKLVRIFPDKINRKELFNYINKQSLNTNGFDIRIDSKLVSENDPGILVEVKCNTLIKNRFGEKQRRAIYDDAKKLTSGGIKMANEIDINKNYIRIIAIVNLNHEQNPDKFNEIISKQIIKPKKNIKTLELILHLDKSTLLSEDYNNKIFITILTKNDLKEELNKILKNKQIKEALEKMRNRSSSN